MGSNTFKLWESLYPSVMALLYPCFISVLPSYSFYILQQSEAARNVTGTEWVDVSWENSKTLPGWRHAQFPLSIYWTYKKDYSMGKNSPASLPFLHWISGHTFHIKMKFLLLLYLIHSCKNLMYCIYIGRIFIKVYKH